MDKFMLIAEVHKRPELWKSAGGGYSYRASSVEAWKTIALQMGPNVTADECKRTWFALRRTFFNIIQLEKSIGIGKHNQICGVDWQYFEALKFLKVCQKNEPATVDQAEDNDYKIFPQHLAPSSDYNGSNVEGLRHKVYFNKSKLIAEIHKREALWKYRRNSYASREQATELWQEVAASMGPNVSVEKCRSYWANLRRTYFSILNHYDSYQVKHEDVNNPNEEYYVKWSYFEAMKFLESREEPNAENAGTTSITAMEEDDSREQSQSPTPNVNDNVDNEPNIETDGPELTISIDKMKLIAEIHKRPALWKLRKETLVTRAELANMWKEVALSLGPNVTVNKCKRTWVTLRCTYFSEIKRLEELIKRDIGRGTYSFSNEYTSRWVYYQAMKFIKPLNNRSIRTSKFDNNNSNEAAEESSNNLEQTLVEDKDDTKKCEARSYDLKTFCDSDYNFLMSCLPQLKMMSDQEKSKFRQDIKDLMLNINCRK